jgi:hypothetical protein
MAVAMSFTIKETNALSFSLKMTTAMSITLNMTTAMFAKPIEELQQTVQLKYISRSDALL